MSSGNPFGKMKVLVKESKTLDDGTFALAISVHGMILLTHVKVATFAFDYSKRRPPEGTYGWDVESIIGINMGVKILAFKFISEEEFADNDYTPPRYVENVPLLEKPKEALQ